MSAPLPSRALVCALAVLMCAIGGCSSEPEQTADAPAAPEIDARARLDAATTPAQRRAVEAQLPDAGGDGPVPVTADSVADRFEERAGVPLVREQAGASYVALTLPLADDQGEPLPDADRLADRWGSFTLYVARDGRRLAERGGLGDVVPSSKPDRRGIVWVKERDAVGEEFFTAHTFYRGGTVMLAWLGDGGKRTGPSFVRLDRLLRGLDRE